jgi:hypothetical protein
MRFDCLPGLWVWIISVGVASLWPVTVCGQERKFRIEIGGTLMHPLVAPFRASPGAPDPYITPYFHTDYQKPGAAGGYSFSLLLGDHYAITLDGIYTSAHFVTALTSRELNGDLFGDIDELHARSWEWPLTASYRFGNSRIQPYGGAGLTLSNRTRFENLGPAPGPGTGSGSSPSFSHGPGAGKLVLAGIAGHLSFFEFAPEVRYVRWTNPSLGGFLWYTFMRKRDEIMVGISIRGKIR